jgi:hypothetical protein
MWDNPTMSIAIVDAKKRTVIAGSRPGDVFDIQPRGPDAFLLVRLQRPEAAKRLTRRECLRAMRRAPLRPRMDWDALKTMTREP